MGEPDERPNHDGSESEGEGRPAPTDPGHRLEAGRAAGAEGPNEDSESAPDTDTPADLSVEQHTPDLFARVFRVYVRNLWALLVVAGLPLVPLVLLSQIYVVWPASEGAYLNGVLETATDPVGTTALVMLGALCVLGLLVGPIPLGGSVLLGGGALLGRRVTVRDAWRGALRRYFTTLAWALMVLLLMAAALAPALWLLSRDWPLLGIAIVALPPLLLLLTPLSVMLPAALLEGHGPFRGLAAAWRIGRYRRGTHVLFVTVSYGVSVLFGTVLERSLLRWTEMAEGDLALLGITATVSMLTAPLSLLLLCAPVLYAGDGIGQTPVHFSAYDSQGRPIGEPVTPAPAFGVPSGPLTDLDLARVGRQLPGPRSETAGSRVHHLATVPLTVAALFAPPLLGPAALAANPFGLMELTASSLESVRADDLTVDVDATDAGALIGTARRGTQLEWCDPDCAVGPGSQTLRGGSGVSVEGGRLLQTHWQEFEHDEDSDQDRYAPHPESGLYLTVCEDALECDHADAELLRPFDGKLYDIHSAVAPLADGGMVVASHVRHDDRRDLDEVVDGDSGGLRLHVCGDAACADPHILDLPPDLTVGGFITDGAFLHAAGSPEGGFGVAAVDPNFGSFSLVLCAENECAEPEVAEVFGDRFRIEYESRLRPRFGARIEYRSDGTPVAAYRDVRTGEARLVDCHDAVCSEFTDRAVTGPGWARPTPGLAVDSQDRPQLLTPDMAGQELVLLSCLDRSCTETVSTGLVGFESEPAVTALALDARDRPHMVWGEGAQGVFGGGFDAESLYLSCAEPYCGGVPATP